MQNAVLDAWDVDLASILPWRDDGNNLSFPKISAVSLTERCQPRRPSTMADLSTYKTLGTSSAVLVHPFLAVVGVEIFAVVPIETAAAAHGGQSPVAENKWSPAMFDKAYVRTVERGRIVRARMRKSELASTTAKLLPAGSLRLGKRRLFGEIRKSVGGN